MVQVIVEPAALLSAQGAADDELREERDAAQPYAIPGYSKKTIAVLGELERICHFILSSGPLE